MGYKIKKEKKGARSLGNMEEKKRRKKGDREVENRQKDSAKCSARERAIKSTKALPAPLAFIERKPSLKLLGVTFQSDPCNWDLHFDNILSKASSRLHILRVCKFYRLPLDHLHILFTSLILSIFTYAVEVWGCAYYHKYLSRIDRLFKRAFKLGYCKERFFIENIIALKDKKLWDKITDSNLITALDDLLPPKRTMVTLRERRHNYIIPLVRTERFKRTFINRCLFL